MSINNPKLDMTGACISEAYIIFKFVYNFFLLLKKKRWLCSRFQVIREGANGHLKLFHGNMTNRDFEQSASKLLLPVSFARFILKMNCFITNMIPYNQMKPLNIKFREVGFSFWSNYQIFHESKCMNSSRKRDLARSTRHNGSWFVCEFNIWGVKLILVPLAYFVPAAYFLEKGILLASALIQNVHLR